MKIDNGLNFEDTNKGISNIEEKPLDYYTDIFSPGQTKQRLRIGREVEGSVSGGGGLYASMLAGNQSIPNNTDTILTGFNTKVGDTAMTATVDQITITQNGNYILSAFAFAGWSSNDIVFRIMKNGVTINPHYREGNTSSLARTTSINTMQTLVAGDVLTLLFFQNSGGAQTLQSAYLALSKL